MKGVGEQRRVSLVTLALLALGVGMVTGAGAVIFRGLIAIIHNVFFLGEFSLNHDSNALTPEAPWGPFIILAPVVGAIGVVYLVRTFAPETRGHGVPEVMDAIYYREGHIRPVVALVKSLASALSIGSGAAVGREGPIIQIGSSFGSTVGQLTRIAAWQRITLLAAGAGAGIAATFNTPLGGVMFAVELMMPEVSARTFLPVVLATGAATYVGRLFFGLQPAFIVPFADAPNVEPLDLPKLGGFVALGLLCGLAAWGFIRLLTLLEEEFSRVPGNDYTRHALGMLIVGVMMYLLARGYDHYYVAGVGYGTIQAVLQGEITALSLLTILFFAKLLATTLSLGSGASGGIFSPSLFLGTTLGGSFGALLALLWPDLGFNPAEFAMVGMAGVVGGGTGAAMTAIVMIFEMTRDYNIIVPIVIAVALAIGVRRMLSTENIYTVKLAWRGRHIPKERHTNMFLVRHAQEVMENPIATLPEEMRLDQALHRLGSEGQRPRHVVVSRGEHILGVVALDTALRCADLSSAARLGEIASSRFVLAYPDDILHDVLKRLGHGHGDLALVIRGRGVPRAGDVVGVIAEDSIANSVLRHFRA